MLPASNPWMVLAMLLAGRYAFDSTFWPFAGKSSG